MIRLFLGTAATSALMLGAAPAMALTAAEAWERLQQLSESMDQTVTAATEKPSAGKLVVSGVALSLSQPDAQFNTTIDEMVFTETGDGSVNVTMSDSYSIDFVVEPEDDDTVTGLITVAQPGIELTMSDGDAGVDLGFTAPVADISIDGFNIDGDPFPLDITLSMGDLSGTYALSDDETLTYQLASASTNFSITAQDPDGNGALEMSVNLSNISANGNSKGNLLSGDPGELRAELDDGAGGATSATFEATTFDVGFSEDGESFQASGTMDGGSFTGSIDAAALVSESTYRNLAFTAQGSEIPLPEVSGAFGELTANMTLPMTVGDAAQPFGMRLVLGDVTVNEMIWSMIDPAGAIKRDPATVALDLSGLATVLVDIFDEDSFMSADEPALLESLDINEMVLSVGGAILTGMGGFTFDNDDRSTFDGMPAPDGTVNLELVGGNALLDTLVSMGLVPQDQAMMARMMTGMLARPGNGPDTLVSEITVRPDGTVLANGAPLPF